MVAILWLTLLFGVVQANVMFIVPYQSKSRTLSSLRQNFDYMTLTLRRADKDHLPTTPDIASRRNGDHDALDRMIAFIGTIVGGLALYETMGKLAI